MKRTEKQISTGKAYLSRYNASTATELYHVYGSYSAAKARAMVWCKDKAARIGIGSVRIISHNTMQFTVAFPCIIDGVKCIAIETARNSYVYPVE